VKRMHATASPWSERTSSYHCVDMVYCDSYNRVKLAYLHGPTRFLTKATRHMLRKGQLAGGADQDLTAAERLYSLAA
jgi:hypothetical protein